MLVEEFGGNLGWGLGRCVLEKKDQDFAPAYPFPSYLGKTWSHDTCSLLPLSLPVLEGDLLMDFPREAGVMFWYS